MDKIEKIRKAIERRKGYISVTHFAEELLSFLDTLKEEPDKSLEEEVNRYLEEQMLIPTELWQKKNYQKFARHFAEWGAEHLRDSTKMVDKGLEKARREYDTQKYTPSPSVGIEDVARVQFASHAKVFDKKRKAVFDWEQFKEVAGIFYGFGKKDSPETKEKEQPDKDLEEAADSAAIKAFPENKSYSTVVDRVVDYSAIDRKNYRDGFIAGAKWDRDQMLRGAKDGYVSAIIIHNDGDEEHYAVTYPNGERPHSITDKVKIIIL